MNDADLIEYAASFRRGLLGDRPSQSMCAAVSWPLAGMLRFDGVECEAVESDLSGELGLLHANHVWIRLADGRALDPTADQFNRWCGGPKFPPVYLGAPLEIHGAPAPIDDVRRLLPAPAIESQVGNADAPTHSPKDPSP